MLRLEDHERPYVKNQKLFAMKPILESKPDTARDPKSGFCLSLQPNTLWCLKYSDQLIIEAECDLQIIAAALPFDPCLRPDGRAEIERFFAKPLQLNGLNAVLVADLFELIKPFPWPDPRQELLFETWEAWDFKLKVIRGISLIKQMLQAQVPTFLEELSTVFATQEHDVIGRSMEVRELYDDDYDREDSEREIPF